VTEDTSVETPTVTAPTRNATVIRFSPIGAEAILKKAGQAHRHCGAHLVSVFASDPYPDENQDEVVARILAASELQDVKPETNKKFWWLAEAGLLYDSGYSLRKYGFEGEIPEHFSIDLGNSPTIEDAKRISELFIPRRRDQ